MTEPRGTSVPVQEHVRRVSAWVAEEPISRAVIDAVWGAEHGTRYAPTAESYRAAVRLVVGHLWDAGDVSRPVWWDTAEADLRDVTPIGTRLMDALMFHVGHMSADGNLQWGVVTDPDSASYGDPYVLPHPHKSVGRIPSVFARVIAGRSGLSALEKPLRRAGAEHAPGCGVPLRDDEFPGAQARKARRPRWGRPIGGVRTWDVEVPEPLAEIPEVQASVRAPMTIEQLVSDVKESDRPDYTHIIWVHELAELEWGTDQFGAFERRLTQEPGIEAVLREDREPVYVRARTLTADQVLAAARRAAQ